MCDYRDVFFFGLPPLIAVGHNNASGVLKATNICAQFVWLFVQQNEKRLGSGVFGCVLCVPFSIRAQ